MMNRDMNVCEKADDTTLEGNFFKLGTWLVRHKSLLFLIMLNLLLIFVAPYLANRETLQRWLFQIGFIGPVIAFVILLIVSLAPGFTSDPFAIAAGALFGFIIGFVITWLAQFSATLIGHFLVRNSIQELSVVDKFGQKVNKSRWLKWLKSVPVSSPIFLIAARWLPMGYGGELVYILAGIYQVPFWRLVWCTAISVMVPAIQFPAVGAGLTRVIKIFGK